MHFDKYQSKAGLRFVLGCGCIIVKTEMLLLQTCVSKNIINMTEEQKRRIYIVQKKTIQAQKLKTAKARPYRICGGGHDRCVFDLIEYRKAN